VLVTRVKDQTSMRILKVGVMTDPDPVDMRAVLCELKLLPMNRTPA